jgi:hypothetical protein
VDNESLHFNLHQPTSWTFAPIKVIRIPTRDAQPLYAAEFMKSHALTSIEPPIQLQTQVSFASYIKTIPKLDHYLLKHTSFPICARITMNEIQSFATQGVTVFEVSDGSMKNQSLSFGWVIGTEHGHKLAWGKDGTLAFQVMGRVMSYVMMSLWLMIDFNHYTLSLTTLVTSTPYAESVKLLLWVIPVDTSSARLQGTISQQPF